MKRSIRMICALSASMAVLMPPEARSEKVRVAVIDPLSGAFAPNGENKFHSFQMIAELANKEQWAGDNTIEYVEFDNKGSPQESLSVLKTVIDQGFRYITQGESSAVALALVDALNKHNERNPGAAVVFLNNAAVDPDLTNSKCSFWHFRFDANSDMKMEALTTFMAPDTSIKKVYIIGQNYSHGMHVSRAAKENLKRKRPDVQIVGDDLHPIGTVKDFSPYVAKIKASGADTVITGNWGADLALLIKAAKDADLRVNFYTYYGATTGVPTAMGAAGANRVKNINYWTPNNEGFVGKELLDTFKLRYRDDFYRAATYSVTVMLAQAIKNARSTDPTKVAFALEGLKAKSLNGEITMRKSDHQLLQPMYISTWVKTNGAEVRYDQENTGFGWKTNQKLSAETMNQPSTCEMKRPAQS